MKIEKLSNTKSSYRIRKTYKGKTYQVVVPYKPTQKEALQLMAEVMDVESTETAKSATFEDCAIKYMSAREKVLSPATIRGYGTIVKALSKEFKDTRMSDITQNIVQREINDYSVGRAAKSAKNAKSFICAVIKESRPNLRMDIALPQERRQDMYIPTPEDIKKLLEYAEGKSYYIGLVLGCYGFRRSEVCALTADDVDGNVIHISKAKVRAKDGYVIKPPKTKGSDRYVAVPQEIADAIKENGCAFDGYPDSLRDYMSAALDRLEIPHFRFHDLRHFFATELSQAGYSEADILYLGGWSTPYTMKRVYRHQRIDRDAQARQEASDKLQSLIL